MHPYERRASLQERYKWSRQSSCVDFVGFVSWACNLRGNVGRPYRFETYTRVGQVKYQGTGTKKLSGEEEALLTSLVVVAIAAISAFPNLLPWHKSRLKLQRQITSLFAYLVNLFFLGVMSLHFAPNDDVVEFIIAFWLVTAVSPLLRFILLLPGDLDVRLFYYWHSAIHVIGILVFVFYIYSSIRADLPVGIHLFAVLIFSLSLWGIRGVLNQPKKIDTTGH
jgi:hypothetical protein